MTLKTQSWVVEEKEYVFFSVGYSKADVKYREVAEVEEVEVVAGEVDNGILETIVSVLIRW